MKLALAMIVKGSDDEAVALNRCLSNISKHVDGIFITRTHKPGEEPNEAVKNVAEYYNTTVSDYEWTNDFGAARNFNFSQVPKEFTHILWLDADDVIRNGQKIKPTIENYPEIDAFTMSYMYSFDEWRNPIVVHLKTQIVKNDDSVSWVGKLHEDFHANRQLTRFLMRGVERMHFTDEARILIAKERNLEVAQHDVEINPQDPRSYWNLGNSYKALGRSEEALGAFDKFLKMSDSEEEKYIVRLRRAESFWAMNKKTEAIEEARYAIGLRPEYPDAYHLLGSLFFENKQFEYARDMYMTGLYKKPPYHSIIVYNPRDYDYVPLMNLAKTYFNMELPMLALEALKACALIYSKDKNLKTLIKKMEKESARVQEIMDLAIELQDIKDDDELKTCLATVPKKFESHPAICRIRNTRFVKKESSGKDLVIFCGFTEEEWTPDTAKKKGIGGSEEAVIHLAKRFSKLGYKVTVFNKCGHKEKVYDGVTYKPFWTWNYNDKQDVTILWRHPRYLDYDINSTKIFVDMHDVLPEGEFTPERLAKCHGIFVKSKFHRSLFPNVADDKFIIIPNGIDPAQFKGDVARDPMLIVNTSSPDRSLSAFIDCFAEVKKRVPEAKAIWAYGWGVYDSAHASNANMIAWKDEVCRKMAETDGFTALGRINHAEIAKLYQQANVFGYPTEFAEIDCISARKAQLAGAIPVVTDFAALDETVKFGYKIHSDKTKDTWCKSYQFDFALEDPEKRKEWVDRVVELLENPLAETDRLAMRAWADQDNWDVIAQRWNIAFKQCE